MPFGSRSWLQTAPGGFQPYRLVNWHGSGMGSWWWTTRAARSRSCSSPTAWCWASSSGWCCCSSPSAWSWSYPPCTRVAAQGRLGWRCQLQAIPFLLKKVQCWGSVRFWSGSGSRDPMDPDTGGPKTYGSPILKVTKQKMRIQLFLTVAFKNWKKRFSGSEIYKSRLSGSERKISGSKNIFKCYGTVTVTLCFKDDKSNESQNCIGFKVFLIFCMKIEGSRSGSTGSTVVNKKNN